MHLDAEERATIKLALQIAVQRCGENLSARYDAHERCANYCMRRFADLVKRIEQAEKDEAEEKADG